MRLPIRKKLGTVIAILISASLLFVGFYCPKGAYFAYPSSIKKLAINHEYEQSDATENINSFTENFLIRKNYSIEISYFEDINIFSDIYWALRDLKIVFVQMQYNNVETNIYMTVCGKVLDRYSISL